MSFTLGMLLTWIGRQAVRPAIGWLDRPQDIERVTVLIESGAMRPVIDRAYPLEEAVSALRHVADGHVRGKVVVRIANG